MTQDQPSQPDLLASCSQAVQNFQALARAIQAANDSLQHLSMVQLPPYSSVSPNTVAPAADVAVSPPASVKASTPIPHTTPNSPVAAPAEIPEPRPSSPGAHSPAATPAEILESRSPSPSAHSTGTDSDDWDGFGSNPIALIDKSDLPLSLQAPVPNNSVDCPEPTRMHIETVPEDRWYAVIVGRRPGIIHGAHNINKNIIGIPGGYAERFPTRQLASDAYFSAIDAGRVRQVEVVITQHVVTRV